jgi:hypothetical protein
MQRQALADEPNIQMALAGAQPEKLKARTSSNLFLPLYH